MAANKLARGETIPDRLAWVDYAKGLGIVLVVYGHVARGLMSAGWVNETKFLSMIDGVIYSFHMPLFFMLSGIFYFKSISSKGALPYLAGKFDTIFYPYLIWSVAQGLIHLLFSSFTNEKPHAGFIFSLLIAPRAQFWYLYALLIISIASAALLSPRRMWVGAFFVALSFLTNIFVVTYSPLPAVNYILKYFIYFGLGAYLGIFIKNIAHRFFWGWPTLILLAIFLIAQGFQISNASSDYSLGIVQVFFALLGSALILSLSFWLSTRSSMAFVQYLGKASLSIFIFHIIFCAGTRVILKSILGVDNIPAHIALGLIVGCVAPYLIHHFVSSLGVQGVFSSPKKISLERWLGGVKNK
jgi:fucose 4-O-acetylase-like acetyltransferase